MFGCSFVVVVVVFVVFVVFAVLVDVDVVVVFALDVYFDVR